MQEILIDEEFKLLLPALDERSYVDLEENILTYGCLIPLVLWKGILIDGHHRYSILKKYDLPYETKSMEFDSREAVLIWIVSTQIARRNLNPLQLSYFRGLHYNTDKKTRGDITRMEQDLPKAQNGPLGGSTAIRLADQYNVSRNTIKRDAQIATAIGAIGETSPETKRDILAGKTRISRKQLIELASGTEEDAADIVSQIKNGTFKSRITRSEAADNESPFDGEVNPWSDIPGDTHEMQPWERAFGKMTDEFRLQMRTLAKSNDTKAVRSALRLYIGMLEDLYENI